MKEVAFKLGDDDSIKKAMGAIMVEKRKMPGVKVGDVVDIPYAGSILRARCFKEDQWLLLFEEVHDED